MSRAEFDRRKQDRIRMVRACDAYMVEHDVSICNAAARLGFPKSTIFQWYKAWKKGGDEALGTPGKFYTPHRALRRANTASGVGAILKSGGPRDRYTTLLDAAVSLLSGRPKLLLTAQESSLLEAAENLGAVQVNKSNYIQSTT